MEFTEKQLKNFWCFLVETFEFSDEQTAAIDKQIPMTQEIYDSILDKCTEIGGDANHLFFRMLDEYPDFMSVYADRIEEEVKNIELPEISEKEWEIQREKLYARIRAEHGEDAI